MAAVGPLVTADWLGKQLHDDEIRVIDCRFYLSQPERGNEEYLAGHIPGATYLSLDEHLTAASGPGRHPLPEPREFQRTLRNEGVGDEHTVIVYDQDDASTAARLWWMLRSLGHTKTVVLDGGWQSWTAEPRSATTEVPRREATGLALAAEWSGIIDRDAIAADDAGLFLIDSREPARYRGEVEPIDPVAGHIPGSFNIPYHDNTDAEGTFLSKGQLRERFASVTTDEQIVAYCGSGVTACNNILAMEIAGITDVTLYPGSWSDWCTSGGAIATATREPERTQSQK